MSIAQRLRRLEQTEQERMVLDAVERIAKRHDVHPDEILREAQELAARIRRWGIDAELHRMALDFGCSEEEIRALYEETFKELYDEEPGAGEPSLWPDSAG